VHDLEATVHRITGHDKQLKEMQHFTSDSQNNDLLVTSLFQQRNRILNMPHILTMLLTGAETAIGKIQEIT